MDKTLFGFTVGEVVADIKQFLPFAELLAAKTPTGVDDKVVALLKNLADSGVLEKVAGLFE